MDSCMIFAIKFGENIMKILFVHEDIPWEPTNGLHRIYPDYCKMMPTESLFTIATGIEAIIEHNIEDIDDCHRELEERGEDNKKDFCFYALQAVPAFFPDGYCHEAMLSYCAMVAGVCRKCEGSALDSAAEVITVIVNAFLLTGEFNLIVFDELAKVAKRIMKALNKQVKNCFTFGELNDLTEI